MDEFKPQIDQNELWRSDITLSIKGLVEAPLYASDLSEGASECILKNCDRYDVPVVIKEGSLLEPWVGEKFDIVVDDISGVAEEAAKLAVILCKGEDLDKVTPCADAILKSFNPPACGGALNVTLESNIDTTSSQQLISANTAEVESALKADLKTAYDNSQDGSADAAPPLLGDADSEVDQETRNTTVNNTINEISMNMRSEIENFQKKNNDSSQIIKVELFPGMAAGSCDFGANAAIKSISNIGTQAAMGAIAKAQMEVTTDTKAKNSQVAKATSGGGMGGMM